MKQIRLLDLGAHHHPLRDDLLRAMTQVLDSQHFIMGEEVKRLETEIAAYTGVSRAVGCASGSDALYLALLAGGVGHGDEVLTTPFSFLPEYGRIRDKSGYENLDKHLTYEHA